MKLLAQLVRNWRARGVNPLETEVVARQVNREERAVGAAARSSATAETRLEHVRSEVATAIANDGIIDAAEARVICTGLIDVSVVQNQTTAQLRALT